MTLNELNNNVTRLINNSSNILKFLKEFAVDSAKNVSITYINTDGSESVKTMPNISKMVATYNITNKNGVIKDIAGNVLLDKTYRKFITRLEVKADTLIPLCKLNEIIQKDSAGSYFLEVKWTGDNEHYWYGGMSAMFYLAGTRIYNGVSELIPAFGVVHHRNGRMPKIYIKSNGDDGSYGSVTIYIDAYYSGTIGDVTISLRKVIS